MWALAPHGGVWHAVIEADWAPGKLRPICSALVMLRREARVQDTPPTYAACARCLHARRICHPPTCRQCQNPRHGPPGRAAREEHHGR